MELVTTSAGRIIKTVEYIIRPGNMQNLNFVADKWLGLNFLDWCRNCLLFREKKENILLRSSYSICRTFLKQVDEYIQISYGSSYRFKNSLMVLPTSLILFKEEYFLPNSNHRVHVMRIEWRKCSLFSFVISWIRLCN